MIFTSENNWYRWYYDTDDYFGRQKGDQQFKTSFGIYNGVVKSFKEELISAARSTVDHSTDTISLLFSGGVDSELILRSFIEIGYKPKVYIFRYEKDYNIYDVSYAVTICSLLNTEYSIIDLNLTKFYEGEFEKYSELGQIDRPRALPYCKMLDLVDGFPVLGGSDLSPTRYNINYDEDGRWHMRCWEHDIGWSKFLLSIDRHGIGEWFKWTPGLVLSYMQLNWFKNLINDRYYGKLGSSSTKIIGYREAFTDLIDRKKQTGFERIDFLVEEAEKYLLKKYKGLPYRNYVDRTVNELWREITGTDWIHSL